jgi:hypothetical protein
MKKIMILYRDGTIQTKKEKKIDKSDIKNADYFLISISPDNENYTMIKPSKYLLFSKAIIEYQLCMFYTEDDYDHVNAEMLNPVRVEVDSICDMIGLLNSIDRLGIANYIINPDYIADFGNSIGVVYFRVQLFDDRHIIYDEHYQLKNLDSPMFDPYQVLKHFKEIYQNTLMSTFFTKKEYLHLYIKDNQLYWNINNDKKIKSKLIGMPLPISNTITLFNKDEYSKIKSYKYMNLYTCVYYEKNSFIADMSEMIVNGKTIEERECLSDIMNDVFLDESHLYTMYQHPEARLVEIISHSVYTLNLLYIMYSELYGTFNEKDKYDFDIILTFGISHSFYDYKKTEFSINRYSILSISNILDNLSA